VIFTIPLMMGISLNILTSTERRPLRSRRTLWWYSCCCTECPPWPLCTGSQWRSRGAHVIGRQSRITSRNRLTSGTVRRILRRGTTTSSVH